MPLNTLRLNHAPSSHPNPLITFIKPLPQPSAIASATAASEADQRTADTFLHAVAAQCLPIMKKHHLSITTLEEHEPNREFIGRNFNNGEIVQLVLRTRQGKWLGLDVVMMVLMHELAHNTHMNHGKGFWEVRNVYVGELRGLWARGYTGEGFWGKGSRLSELRQGTGENLVGSAELEGLVVCGGTFRSRRGKRKRKVKEELGWREKRDRRIERKFGKNGVSLGEDEDRRFVLEMGRKGSKGGKPRVAGSARGRELRAAAALARFETNKKEVEHEKRDDVKEEESGSDDYEDPDEGLEDARDVDGHRLLDGAGRGMVKVCGEDDTGAEQDRVFIKKEMEELSGLDRYFESTDRSSDLPENDRESNTGADIAPPSKSPQTAASEGVSAHLPPPTNGHNNLEPAPKSTTSESPPTQNEAICPVCSLSNSSTSTTLTCAACAHVLYPKLDQHHWACASESCKDLGYLNAGDVGVCGLCGVRKIAGL